MTTVPRTILDLAATEPLDVVKALLREMEFRELRDSLSLRDLVERYPGGVAFARWPCARSPEGRTDRTSTRARWRNDSLRSCRQHGLPLPRFNDSIVVGDKRFQVDCLWPDLRQIVELDGWQGHKTRSAFREDRARDRRLRVAGYAVTRLTWNQLEDEPEAVASDLRVLLGTNDQKRLSWAAATSTCRVEVAAADPSYQACCTNREVLGVEGRDVPSSGRWSIASSASSSFDSSPPRSPRG